MKIKKIKLNNFKWFTHLCMEEILETAKLVVLVGLNGSGKTLFIEAMNHYYKCAGYNDTGDYHYLSKVGNETEEIEKESPGTVAFLDFSERDFDTEQVIRPAKIGKAIMDKFYGLTFDDFAKLMLPKIIVFCEGDPNGKARKDFDKIIYSTIFFFFFQKRIQRHYLFRAAHVTI